MSLYDDDRMHVKISVEVTKDRSGYASGERLSYGQEFDIAARGFAGVAKILGDLDLAVGSIERYKPSEAAGD